LRIAAISGVKNEADVIESFVRHNARFINDFYFIDDSVDNTKLILRALASEGKSISILNLDTRDYQHSQIMTSATRLVGQHRKYDWIFYLDADEFIYPKSAEAFYKKLEESSTERVGAMQMIDYGYNGLPYLSSRNPIKECFQRCVDNVNRIKIFIRGDISNEVIIGTGQHGAISETGQIYRYFPTDIELAHFPARSIDQWKTRTIIRYANLISKLNRFQGEGSHVIEEFGRMKEKKFRMMHPNDIINKTNLTDQYPDLLADIDCKYQHLWDSEKDFLLALELERQAQQLSEYRHAVHAACTAIPLLENLNRLNSKVS
jgi:Glycosyl transferase family 2